MLSREREEATLEWARARNDTPHHGRCLSRDGGDCDCYKARPDYTAAEMLLRSRKIEQAARKSTDGNFNLRHPQDLVARLVDLRAALDDSD